MKMKSIEAIDLEDHEQVLFKNEDHCFVLQCKPD